MNDDLPFDVGAAPAMLAPARPRPHRHSWERYVNDGRTWAACLRCNAVRDETKSRRGKSARRLGHDGERRSERRYGWTKVGEYGGITDLEGTLAIVQQKTSRRDAPPLWRGVFAALAGRAGGRIPLLLLSFVRQGVAAEDYIVIRGSDWLALHGTDAPGEQP